MQDESAAIIAASSLTKRFGGLTAVDKASFSIQRGELVGLLGPNGSGKTTILNMLSGLLSPDDGRITLMGKSVGGRSADEIARAGMIRMFQLTRIFPQMSVIENLLTVGFALGLRRPAALARAGELLAALKLEAHRESLGSDLSGGQQKLLEFASCFMLPPQIALLDEPFAAIHPTMRKVLADYIRTTNADGQTYIVVSHDMPIVIDLCPRAICMAAGVVIADGPTGNVLRNPEVIEAYLGSPFA